VAVKEPWRRSSRYKALAQMLCTINRLDKLAALRRVFVQKRMMVDTTSAHVAGALSRQLDNENEGAEASDDQDNNSNSYDDDVDNNMDDDMDDVAPVAGPRALSSVALSSHRGM